MRVYTVTIKCKDSEINDTTPEFDKESLENGDLSVDDLMSFVNDDSDWSIEYKVEDV